MILNNNHTGSNYRNWIIIRYAEILLNYAEALNEAGGSRADVLNAIQPLRDRVGMTAKLTNRSDLQTIADRRNFIRKERTVELAFEDHRAWDVRRWNVAEKHWHVLSTEWRLPRKTESLSIHVKLPRTGYLRRKCISTRYRKEKYGKRISKTTRVGTIN